MNLAKDLSNKRQMLWEKLWNKLERIRAEKRDMCLYSEDHVIITVYYLLREPGECKCGAVFEEFLMTGYIKADFLDKSHRYCAKLSNYHMYCRCHLDIDLGSDFISVFTPELYDSDIPIEWMEINEEDVMGDLV